MSNAPRSNRKFNDTDLIKRNSLGLSLSTIANEFGVHLATVTLRLRGLGIPPADTRRAFMDDVLKSLSPAQQDWVADQLGPHYSIKDFLKNLIVEQFINNPERNP